MARKIKQTVGTTSLRPQGIVQYRQQWILRKERQLHSKTFARLRLAAHAAIKRAFTGKMVDFGAQQQQYFRGVGNPLAW
jgi:hypothetical protein